MRMRKAFTVLIVMLLCTATLMAASSAESLFQDFSEDCAAGNVADARSSYTDFQNKLEKEWENAQKSLENARKKNNSKLYKESLDELKELTKLGITKEQTEMLLSAIVNGDDEAENLDNAVWLYKTSPYYRPSLSINISSIGTNRRYSYTTSVVAEPGADVKLPTQEEIGYDASVYGHLKGWGITPDEVTYEEGAIIPMPITDQTLYAIWESGVTFNDSVGGTNDVVNDVKEGDVISIPKLENSDGYFFTGWVDETTGEFVGTDEEEYEVRGKGAEFEAHYIKLSAQNASVSPYSSIPRSTQVELSFDVENLGNDDADSVSVELSSSVDGVTFLNDTAYFRRIPAGFTGSVEGMKLVVSNTVASGSEIPIDVTLTDSDGRVWNETFTFTVK